MNTLGAADEDGRQLTESQVFGLLVGHECPVCGDGLHISWGGALEYYAYEPGDRYEPASEEVVFDRRIWRWVECASEGCDLERRLRAGAASSEAVEEWTNSQRLFEEWAAAYGMAQRRAYR